jgi:hypothetical protein
MEHQLTPPSGREDENVLRPWTGSELGVRPGESNSGRMLGAVLLLVLAMVVLAMVVLTLVLVWNLA